MNEEWYERADRRRKELGYTQEQLAPIFGVTTRGAVGHYFRGRREPTLKQLKALAKELNMSLGDLLAGEEIPSPEERRILSKYRQLTRQKQRAWEDIGDAFIKTEHLGQENKRLY